MVSTYFRVVAGVVALALAALSGSVVMCAMLCASSGVASSVTAASAAHAHHTSGVTRHEFFASPRLQSSAASAHPCGDHESNIRRRKAKLAPPRPGNGRHCAFESHVLAQAAIGQLIAAHMHPGHGPPPSPSTAMTPFVLRI